MFTKQTSGAIVCHACNKLVSVDAKTCIHCNAENPGLWGYARSLRQLGYDFGFTAIVTWGCLGIYLFSLLLDSSSIFSRGLFSFLSPSSKSLFLIGSTEAIPIFQFGRWWTILSAGWLHGGFFHIAFNLLWIRQLAPHVTKAYGAARLHIIYTISVITSSLLTSVAGKFLNGLPEILHGAQLSIGASGGLFGLFGALIAYGQQTGHMSVKRYAFNYAIVLFCVGFIMPSVDNWGHLGGFLGGYLMSYTPWLSPRNSQKLRDVFIAITCLATVILSLLISFGHGAFLVHQSSLSF